MLKKDVGLVYHESEIKKYYVYVYIDPRTYQIRYCGKGKKGRAWQFANHCAHCKNWVKQLKSLGLKPMVEILEYFEDEKEALAREVELIALYRYYEFDLTNISDGGEGSSGHKMSEENKQKNAERMRGKQYSLGCKHSEEANLKKSKRMKNQSQDHLLGNQHAKGKNLDNQWALGQKHTEEFKDKKSKEMIGNQYSKGVHMGNTFAKGYKHTDEWKKGQSERKSGSNNWNARTIERSDGKIYKSIKDAYVDMNCKKHKVVYAIINSKYYREPYEGYTFQYIDTYNG